MKMWRVALVPIFLLGMVGAGLAATYEILLNKDEKLCREIFQSVNEDLKKYGEVRYDQHELFKTIEWEPLAEALGAKFKDEGCSVMRLARFDLNNDGRQDIVVKLSGCFRSRYTDSIYFLDGENSAFQTYREFSDIMENSIGRFPAADASALAGYEVKELPPIEKTKDFIGYHGVAGWLTITPFIYHGTSYMTLTGDTKGSFLVGKYKTPTELEVACFFETTKRKGPGTTSKKNRS